MKGKGSKRFNAEQPTKKKGKRQLCFTLKLTINVPVPVSFPVQRFVFPVMPPFSCAPELHPFALLAPPNFPVTQLATRVSCLVSFFVLL